MNRQAELTITHRCNINPRCPGCSDASSHRFGEEERDPEFWCDKIDEIHEELGVNFFMLMGGEITTWPGIEKITRHIAKSKKFDGGFYTNSVALIDKFGNPTKRLKMLIRKGRILDLFVLVSVDFLVETEPDFKTCKDPSLFKSYQGLKLLEYLRKIREDNPLVLHQLIKPQSIDHVIPLHEKALSLGVYYSCCTFIWRPYVQNPTKPVSISKFRGSILTRKHVPKLIELSNELIRRETERLKEKRPRSIAVSSAFLQQLPKNGVTQRYRCKRRPNIFDVTTQGEIRWCGAMDTREEGLSCPGCAFVHLDRVDHYLPLEIPDEVSWKNLIRNRKCGLNLNSLVVFQREEGNFRG